MITDTPLGELPAVAHKPFGIIYIAKNKTNGKIYIGQTVKGLHSRKLFHKYGSRVPENQTHIGHAILKYGIEGFEWTELDTASSREELNEKERFWIIRYDSRNRDIGYNIDEGGYRSEISEETRAKISATKRAKMDRGEYTLYQVGKATSAEIKEKIRATKKAQMKPKEKKAVRKRGFGNWNIRGISVRCIETGVVYPSISAAGRAHQVRSCGFTKLFRGERQSVAGFHWERVSETVYPNTNP